MSEFKPACRILIVDDDPDVRHLFRSMMRRHGYQIIEARNGPDALVAVAQDSADLVLLDVSMPGMDGIEVCQRIRNDLGRTFLPVIMITAAGDRALRLRAKEAGVDELLTKPPDELELLARMRILLRMKACHEAREQLWLASARHARRSDAVSRVADAVASSCDLAYILRELRSAVANEVPFDAMALLAMAGEDLVVLASEGTIEAALPAGARLRAWGAEFATFVGSGAKGIADVAQSESPLDRDVTAGGTGSLVRVPLLSAGRPVAALAVSRAQVRPFEADEVALLEHVGAHVAHAYASIQKEKHAQEAALLRERFAHLLVHDLKNPLSIIVSELDYIEAHPSLVDPSLGEAVSDSKRASLRLQGMLQDLLDMARVEEGRLQLNLSELSLGALVEEVAEARRKVALRQSISVRLSLPRVPLVVGDRELLRRVIDNLLSNALRYAPAGPSVEMGVNDGASGVVAFVANAGPSIPDELKARLFQKYGQLDAAGISHVTQGLGLYFCRLVMEAHHGAIAVGDREGGGVRFDVSLSRRDRVRSPSSIGR